MTWLILAAMAMVVSAVLANDGYTTGNWNFRQFDLGTRAAPLASLSPYHIRVTYPTTCNSRCGEFRTGGMPVFLFATGFGGQIDAYNYDVILSGIARHGIIVVAIDREAGFSLTLDFGKLGLQMQKVIGWIRQVDPSSGLLYELQQRGFTNSILNGAARIIMGGHNTGVQIPLRNIKDTAVAADVCPDAGGMVMIEPLDGQDPLGFGGDTVVTNGQNLPFSTPGLIIAGSLDPATSTVFEGVSCNPDARSNMHFYNPWVGAINYMQFQGVGTLDVLNEAASTIYSPYCVASNPSATTLRLNYRNSVRGAIVNFIQAVVLNSQDYASIITSVPANTATVNNVQSKGVGYGYTCTAIPVSGSIAFELQTGLILFGFFFALTFITGLYCFFRKMDDDTLHRYHPAEGIGYDQPASFQTKLEPQYGVSQTYQQQNSFNLTPSQASQKVSDSHESINF